MKKIFILIKIIVLVNNIQSQNYQLKFSNKNFDYLYLDTIDNNYILCLIKNSTSIESIIKHIFIGKFKNKNKKLILYSYENFVKTNLSDSKYTLNFFNKNSNLFSFKVLDTNLKPIKTVFIGYSTNNNNSEYVQTDRNGFAEIEIEKMPIDSNITIGLTLYQNLIINLDSLQGADYTIILYPGNILIHKKREIFKYSIKNDSLYLYNKKYQTKLKKSE